MRVCFHVKCECVACSHWSGAYVTILAKTTETVMDAADQSAASQQPHTRILRDYTHTHSMWTHTVSRNARVCQLWSRLAYENRLGFLSFSSSLFYASGQKQASIIYHFAAERLDVGSSDVIFRSNHRKIKSAEDTQINAIKILNEKQRFIKILNTWCTILGIKLLETADDENYNRRCELLQELDANKGKQ